MFSFGTLAQLKGGLPRVHHHPVAWATMTGIQAPISLSFGTASAAAPLSDRKRQDARAPALGRGPVPKGGTISPNCATEYTRPASSSMVPKTLAGSLGGHSNQVLHHEHVR